MNLVNLYAAPTSLKAHLLRGEDTVETGDFEGGPVWDSGVEERTHSEHSPENARLKRENAALLDENERLKRENEQLCDKNEQLCDKNARLRREVDRLVTDKERLVTENNRLTTENERLAREKDVLATASARQHERDARHNQDEASEKAREQVRALEAALAESKRASVRVHGENTLLSREVARMRGEIGAVRRLEEQLAVAKNKLVKYKALYESSRGRVPRWLAERLDPDVCARLADESCGRDDSCVCLQAKPAAAAWAPGTYLRLALH